MGWQEWEQDNGDGTKRYGLAPKFGSFGVTTCDGDLGTGAGQFLHVFQHPEGRTYFKQWYATDRQLTKAVSELEWLKGAIRACLTPSGRVRRKRLLKLAETVK